MSPGCGWVCVANCTDQKGDIGDGRSIGRRKLNLTTVFCTCRRIGERRSFLFRYCKSEPFASIGERFYWQWLNGIDGLAASDDYGFGVSSEFNTTHDVET